jgi:hypothetical protein
LSLRCSFEQGEKARRSSVRCPCAQSRNDLTLQPWEDEKG